MRTFDTALMKMRMPGEAVEMPSAETDPYYGMRGLGQTETPVVEIVDTTIRDRMGNPIPWTMVVVTAGGTVVKQFIVSGGRLEGQYIDIPKDLGQLPLDAVVSAPGYETRHVNLFGNRGTKGIMTMASYHPISLVLYKPGEPRPTAMPPSGEPRPTAMPPSGEPRPTAMPPFVVALVALGAAALAYWAFFGKKGR